jgi:hypothetical protein
MTMVEIHQLIARLRRDMPRHEGVLALCEATERLMASAADRPPLTRAEIQKNYRERRKKSTETA